MCLLMMLMLSLLVLNIVAEYFYKHVCAASDAGSYASVAAATVADAVAAATVSLATGAVDAITAATADATYG